MPALIDRIHVPASAHPPPLSRAFISQAAGVVAAVAAAALWPLGPGTEINLAQFVAVQALFAAATAAALGMAWWWRLLNLVFVPGLAAGIALALPPFWSAAAFVLLLLAYGGTQETRVPLYLSSASAVNALRDIIAPDRPVRVLDLGCGTGTVLAALAISHPLAELRGVERAPLPWLVAAVRSWIGRGNFHVAWGNLWTADLSGVDVVYAYLSPVPMPLLWEKARREMRSGTVLVSFRFPIPGVAPDRVVDAGGNRLYLWRLP